MAPPRSRILALSGGLGKFCVPLAWFGRVYCDAANERI
jgi:hypothetical protein